MKATEAIDVLLKENGKTKAMLARKVEKTPQALNSILKNGNMTVDTLLKMCEALGEYELVIQPRRQSGPRPKGQIVLD